MIWIHVGNSSSQSLTIHIGTDIAGIHARFAGTVNRSDKYIFTGSSTFSQIFHGISGVVGRRIKSYSEKTLLKSYLNFCLAFWALR